MSHFAFAKPTMNLVISVSLGCSQRKIIVRAVRLANITNRSINQSYTIVDDFASVYLKAFAIVSTAYMDRGAS